METAHKSVCICGIFVITFYFNYESYRSPSVAKPAVTSEWKTYPPISSLQFNKSEFRNTTFLEQKSLVSREMLGFQDRGWTVAMKQDCSLWKIPDRLNVSKKPLIKLNPSLYLYPGMVGGPNNQIVRFIQAIYLAVRLNRYCKNMNSIL